MGFDECAGGIANTAIRSNVARLGLYVEVPAEERRSDNGDLGELVAVRQEMSSSGMRNVDGRRRAQ